MAAFYGTLEGARGPSTRCGTKSSGIHAAAQSWDGSVAVDLYVGADDVTFATISVGSGSTSNPKRVLYYGPLADLLQAGRMLITDVPEEIAS
jgi:hypothetical protein